MLDVALHSSRQNARFDIATNLSQILRAHGVIHALHVLFDNWALIKIVRDVMCGCADNFDTPGMRLVIRASTFEAR